MRSFFGATFILLCLTVDIKFLSSLLSSSATFSRPLFRDRRVSMMRDFHDKNSVNQKKETKISARVTDIMTPFLWLVMRRIGYIFRNSIAKI